MKEDYKNLNRGIEIIEIEGSYQLCTKKEYFDYIYPIFDNRAKPNLSQAALETLAIIAYNPKITRAEIEAIRGVNSDGTIYKLLDYVCSKNILKPFPMFHYSQTSVSLLCNHRAVPENEWWL